MKIFDIYTPDKHCFTFEEAAILFDPIFEGEDFIHFLIRNKFLNELAQPEKEMVKGGVFRFAAPKEGNRFLYINDRQYFITLPGMTDIFRAALVEIRSLDEMEVPSNPLPDQPIRPFIF